MTAVVCVFIVVCLVVIIFCLVSHLSRQKKFEPGTTQVLSGTRDLGDGTVVVLQVAHEDPLVLVGEGFLSEEESKHLISENETLLHRSTVYAKDGSHEEDKSRTSSTAFLPTGSPGSLIEKLEQRASLLLSVPKNHLERLQMIRYEPSEKYDQHVDFFTSGPDKLNNRTKTALVYLNNLDPKDDGGSTHFSKLNLKIKPKVGRVVVWHNCAAEYGKAATDKNCDDRTLHAGEPPMSSVKFALNIWARNLPAR